MVVESERTAQLGGYAQAHPVLVGIAVALILASALLFTVNRLREGLRHRTPRRAPRRELRP
jgi:hypothetical protein